MINERKNNEFIYLTTFFLQKQKKIYIYIYIYIYESKRWIQSM